MNKKHPIMLFLLTILLTILSANSQACTVAPDPDLNNDGIVDKNDLVIVTRSNGLKTSHPRYNPQADINCDGKVNPTDIHFVNKALGEEFSITPTASIKAWFDKWNSDETIVLDESKALSIAINLRSIENTEILVNLSQSIFPASGISLSPSFDNTEIVFDSSGYKTIGQQVSAEEIGEYTITTIMTEPISGETDTFIRKITVLEQGELDVEIGLATQAYVPVDFNGEIKVGSDAVGNDYQKVTHVTLKILETGEKFTLPKIRTAFYHNSIAINTQGMDVGDCLSLQVVVSSTKGDLTSKIKKVCVTGFPLHLGNNPQVFIETSNGTAIALDQLVVRFREGTPEARIREILSTLGGEVVGTATDLIFFRVGFTPAPETLQELEQKKNQLNSFFEVETAEFNLRFGQIQSVLPANDPLLAISGGQESIFQTRADEAWFVVQGDVPIAVVDTGIDLTGHPDLDGKILVGKNFVAGEDETYPHDRHGHGTHVAGIIGAKSNNAKGITGYSWNSPLLAVKMTRDRSKFWYDVVVDGLRYAASSDVKPTLINASLGIREDAIDSACEEANVNCNRQSVIEAICREVTIASGNNITVVGAAGNDFKNEKNYPGACHHSFTVGATTASDGIWTSNLTIHGSNYGNWVDIAAPGEEILSTETTDPDPDPSCVGCGTESDSLYNFRTGTSQATPAVTGSLAVLFKRHPEWMKDPSKAMKRLKDTAQPIKALTNVFFDLGAGRIDLFEAVFNGNFELVKPDTNEPEEWEKYTLASKACESKQEELGLLPVDAEHNQRMLVCDNTTVFSVGSMNTLDIPEGVTELPISFDWRFVAEDLNEIGLPGVYMTHCSYKIVYLPYYPYYSYQYTCENRFMPRNDYILVQLIKNDDSTKRIRLFRSSLADLENSTLTPNPTNGWLQNDWQHFSKTVPITTGAGKYTLRIQMYHSGFTSFDPSASTSLEGATIFMMDRLRFKEI